MILNVHYIDLDAPNHHVKDQVERTSIMYALKSKSERSGLRFQAWYDPHLEGTIESPLCFSGQ